LNFFASFFLCFKIYKETNSFRWIIIYFIIFFHIGGLLCQFLTFIFWAPSGLSILGLFYQITLGVVVMLFLYGYTYKEADRKLYYPRLSIKLSASYFISIMIMFLFTFLFAFLSPIFVWLCTEKTSQF